MHSLLGLNQKIAKWVNLRKSLKGATDAASGCSVTNFVEIWA